MLTYTKHHLTTSGLVLTVCLLLTGCAHVWKLTVKPVTYPSAQKIQAHVLLQITDNINIR